jgi:hypothetical protein
MQTFKLLDVELHNCTCVSSLLFTTVSGTVLGPTQPPIQWVPGALSLRLKRPGREADHSPPSSAEVKNVWSYTSTPQYVFIAWCLVKHRDNFTFTCVNTFDSVSHHIFLLEKVAHDKVVVEHQRHYCTTQDAQSTI